jgi:selenide,water dikinase
LLVSCAPEAVAAVLEIFARHGFGAAVEIGEVCASGAADGGARLRVV